MAIIDDRLAKIQPIPRFWHQNKVAAMDMLRLDLLHPVVSGNKWFKLRLNLKYATESGYKTIITTGGGYSNHLVATAFAAKMYDIKAVGIVRGKYDVLTPTLMACRDYGMELIFVTTEDYKNRHEPKWASNLVSHFDEIFMIPEGGANEWGRAGAGLITRYINGSYTHIAVSVGTGTTLIGLRNKLPDSQQVLGFAPMKQGAYLKQHISGHLRPDKDRNWLLFDNWHLGGFGKCTPGLIGFMNDFYRENKIPLDMVYTAKMMYGIREMLADNYFSVSDSVLCIHTGGLQGNTSLHGQLVF